MVLLLAAGTAAALTTAACTSTASRPPTPSSTGRSSPSRTGTAPPSTLPSTPHAVPQFRAADIGFSDAHHGWALGDTRCEAGSRSDCPALLSTSDGGRSWHPLAVPKGLVSTFDSSSCGTNGGVTGPCVNAVLPANASDGYLWSLHEIYRTTDGGRTWSRYVDPAHDWDGAASMAVAGGRVIRIAPIQQCSSGCPGAIESAPVGSVAWQVTTPSREQIGLYSSKLAAVGNDVYLFAGGTALNTSPGVYRSRDGGLHWQLLGRDLCGIARDPQQDPFWGAGGIAADDGALITTCLGTDPGTLRVLPPGSTTPSEPRAYPVAGTQLVAAQSEQRIVGVGGSQTDSVDHSGLVFYSTYDGGRTWHKGATVPMSGDSLRFRSGTTGYAIADDRASFYVTGDGGTSWQQLAFSP